MTDKVRALNVSNVAAIMMYEAMRQQNFPNLCEFEPETMKGKDFLLKKYSKEDLLDYELSQKSLAALARRGFSNSCCLRALELAKEAIL